MYDIIGDLVVYSTQPDSHSLLNLLKKGFKKIYLRTPVLNQYRIALCEWISPYPELDHYTNFLHKEGPYYYYGNINLTYYNPRYAYERAKIKEFLDLKPFKNVLIIGSGIGPYAISLGPNYKVSQLEINPDAVRFNLINLTLNNSKATVSLKKYEGETSEVIISMMPSIDHEAYKTYNFSKILIYYVLLESSELNTYQKKIKDHYKGLIHIKSVRPYSKFQNIYRVILE